jgi:hypothetical protein
VCSSPRVIRVINSREMSWAGHIARTGTKRKAHRILVGKPGRKKSLVRPRRKWMVDIMMDFREIDWGNIG